MGKNIARACQRNPEATPAQVIRSLERMYVSALTGTGAAVGGSAAAPGVGTGVALRRFGTYLMTLTSRGNDIWGVGDGMPAWHAFGELTWMAAVLTGFVRYQHPSIEGTRVYRRSKWRCLMGSVILGAPANVVLPDVERRPVGAGAELVFPVSVLPLDTPLAIHDSLDPFAYSESLDGGPTREVHRAHRRVEHAQRRGHEEDDVIYFWHEASVPGGLEITQVYGYLLCPATSRVLIQDDEGSFNLPGGTPEPFDVDLVDTLVREAFEENQVVVTVLPLVAWRPEPERWLGRGREETPV